MDYKQANHVANRRPSLPRLRNKASLGRLQVFGGVLDFDGGNPASGIDSNMNIPPLPILSHIYSTLAGPVSASSSAIQTCTPTQSHNKQHSTREEEHDEDEVIRTPVKNTNSLSTLKRLKALNKDSKYPDSLSNGLPQSNSSSTIPGLDFDHPLLQSQSEISHKQVDRHNIEQDHLHSRHIIHSRPSSVSLHSRESSLDSFSDESPDVNVVLERRKGKLPTRNRSHSHREREAEEKEKERLVNEIKQDMDEGGYASLEQILARNGFKVCRVATPPSSGRISSSKSVITGHIGNASNSDQTIMSQGNASDGISSNIIHPLSRLISASSSNSITASNSTSMTTDRTGPTKTTNGTIKNKTSLLSFSGLVSSLWSNTTRQQVSSPDLVNQDPSNPHGVLSSPVNSPETSQGAIDTSIETPGAGASKIGAVTDIVDRNEEIKGWLRQTFDASNAYMNEARKTIEAARIAIGSPESKKLAHNNNLKKQLNIGRDEDEQNREDVNEHDLLLLCQERRQATTSTLESSILETPTCSPTTMTHYQEHHSSTVESTNDASKTMTTKQQTIVPLYSPPLRQLSQMEPAINDQVTYFDSPLMRKKMKRISIQVRQEYQSSKQESTKAMKYPPPSSCLNKLDVADDDDAEEALLIVDKPHTQEQKKKKMDTPSAESLLRGTLRHALSESALRDNSANSGDACDTAKKAQRNKEDDGKKIDSKTGHRPSIATIFGIPLGFGSSGTMADSGSTSTAVAQGQDKLKQSMTESLSTNTTTSTSAISNSTGQQQSHSSNSSTSAKDTISSSASIPAITQPKLLRKTASKHTLRKAASPILSNNAIVVFRDEDITNDDSPTPVKSKAAITPTSSNSKASVNDSTPVRNRTPIAIRGPMPLKSPSPSVLKNTSSGSTNNAVEKKNATPRQLAHRNPRDSPIGETKVVRSPPTSITGISKRFSPSSSSSNHQQQGTPIKRNSSMVKDDVRKEKVLPTSLSGMGKPGIMDDENDDEGLWSPPRFSSRTRSPLGAITKSSNNNDNNNDTTTSNYAEVKPRLKAKESLERLLAYKQMKQDTKENDEEEENVPPVPAVPATHTQVHSSQKKQIMRRDSGVTADAGESSEDPNDSSNGESEGRKAAKHTTGTLTRKSSFGGTLRGLIGSAVAGWTESTPIMTGDRVAPISSAQTISSSSRRVTILPAQQPSPGMTTNTLRDNKNGRNSRSMRRVKSMYIEGRNSKKTITMGEGNKIASGGHGHRGGSWIAMERDAGNSLILPTIIISDYTHD